MRAHPCLRLLGFIFLAVVAHQPSAAQPFGLFMTLEGAPVHGYLEAPHSAALNPTSAITIEAWIYEVSSSPIEEDCRSVVGKNWTQAWWVGVCRFEGKRSLVSYVKGAAVPLYAGIIRPTRWTHIAVTHNGTTRRHYVDGELVGSLAEAGPLTTSSSPVRIGSDVAHPFSFGGWIDEIRIWGVARTMQQLRSTLNVALTSPQPGLVAVWSFASGDLSTIGADPVGGHDAAILGTGWDFRTSGTFVSCIPSATTLCLLGNRLLVNATFRVGPPGSPELGAKIVPVTNPGSGIFWFFGPDNWEILLKAIDACSFNNRIWIFFSATTDVFFRVRVHDKKGEAKIYFNYPGPPAPAVTDSSAFAACP